MHAQGGASSSKEPYGAGGAYVAEGGGPSGGSEGADETEIFPVRAVRSADELLDWGIAEYTFRPGPDGLLGKGKFSSVYKVADGEGREVALKHTPLWPHHPLIATRLLREPELLGHIPPHPNLVGVEGWIKTKCHFYLIETYSKDHVPLSDIELPLSIAFLQRVLDQLVSVVRDGMHKAAKVVHRDLKTENILCDSNGHIVLLDLGLATHFSASQPRLTTCCGSPAFHSPEIVDALNHLPGEVTYFGPELDIWCIGLTLLVLMLGRRYPIGTSHRDLGVMEAGVQACLDELDVLYGCEGPELQSYLDLRQALQGFLVIDGLQRMRNFDEYAISAEVQQIVAAQTKALSKQNFKSIFFYPSDVRYTLPLYLQPSSPSSDLNKLQLSNPERLPSRRVLSYIRYLLRSAGILYHQLPSSTKHSLHLQCVTPLPPDSSLIPPMRPSNSRQSSFLDSIFGRRSASTPPATRSEANKVELPVPPKEEDKKGHCLKFYLRIDTRAGSSECCATRSIMDGDVASLVGNHAYDAAQHLTRHTSVKQRRLVSDPSGNGTAKEYAKRSQSTPRPSALQAHKIILTLSDARATDYVLMALGPCQGDTEQDADALEPYETDENEQAPSSLEEVQDPAVGVANRGRARATESEKIRSKAESARPSGYLPTLQVPTISRESSRPPSAKRAPLSRQVSDYVAKEHARPLDDKPYDDKLVVRIRSGLMINR